MGSDATTGRGCFGDGCGVLMMRMCDEKAKKGSTKFMPEAVGVSQPNHARRHSHSISLFFPTVITEATPYKQL
jgi:hypothetical protein